MRCSKFSSTGDLGEEEEHRCHSYQVENVSSPTKQFESPRNLLVIFVSKAAKPRWEDRRN